MIEYDKDAIVPPYITEYLRAKTVHNDEFMHSLEKYAEENSVPIVEPETARFLSVMCRTVKPKKILEVGCAIGYSSILMAQATDDDCEIATLECVKIRATHHRASTSHRRICPQAGMVSRFPSQGQQSTNYPYSHATNRTMAARTSRATTLDTSFPIYPSDTDDFCLDIVYCFYTHVKYSIIPFLHISFL